MKGRLFAVWQLAVALLLYPLAFAAIFWVWWTGRPVWIGIIIIAIVLCLDRGWWLIIRGLFGKR